MAQKKPVICMVSDHGCIRVFKEGNALRQHGYEVHLLARQDAFGFNIFNSFGKYVNGEDGAKCVSFYDKHVDIFHIHNEPDWLVPMTRAATKKPIIFDLHDLESMRRQDVPDPVEAQAFNEADGFVHVSETCREYAEKNHGSAKPSIVLPAYVNKRFMPDPLTLPKATCLDSIVYQGGIAVNKDIAKKTLSTGEEAMVGNYRYYVPMAKAFIQDGYNVTFFSAHNVTTTAYHNMGACVLDWVPYPTMLAGLRTHGFGFTGACFSAPLMEGAMPNKLFEYMSQGVIPVALFCQEVEDFVQKHECGIALESLSHVRQQIESHDLLKLRRNILDLNPQLIMEDHIWRLEKLYEQVL